MLVDANILLFAADRSSPHHASALRWLEQALRGARRIGFPWESLVAFVRIATHPRVMTRPLDPLTAWAQVREWIACDVAWIPTPTDRHADVLEAILSARPVTGDLVADAHLAALALEHGLAVCSADTDFARFTEIEWLNPIAA